MEKPIIIQVPKVLKPGMRDKNCVMYGSIIGAMIAAEPTAKTSGDFNTWAMPPADIFGTSVMQGNSFASLSDP